MKTANCIGFWIWIFFFYLPLVDLYIDYTYPHIFVYLAHIPTKYLLISACVEPGDILGIRDDYR